MSMLKNKKGQYLNVFLKNGGCLSDWIIEDLKTNGLIEKDKKNPNFKLIHQPQYIEQVIEAIKQHKEEIDKKYKLLINLYPPGVKYGFYGIKKGILSFYQKERGKLILYRFPKDEIILIKENKESK